MIIHKRFNKINRMMYTIKQYQLKRHKINREIMNQILQKFIKELMKIS